MNKDEMIEKLNDLIKLDFDAVNAYDEAIGRIDVHEVQSTLRQFQDDHRRHISELSAQVRTLGGKPEEKPSVKGFFLKQFTKITSSMGTEAALRAMQANETVTNASYKTALNEGWPANVRPLIEKNYEDEKRHLEYIRDCIQRRVWEGAGLHP